MDVLDGLTGLLQNAGCPVFQIRKGALPGRDHDVENRKIILVALLRLRLRVSGVLLCFECAAGNSASFGAGGCSLFEAARLLFFVAGLLLKFTDSGGSVAGFFDSSGARSCVMPFQRSTRSTNAISEERHLPRELRSHKIMRVLVAGETTRV